MLFLKKNIETYLIITVHCQSLNVYICKDSIDTYSCTYNLLSMSLLIQEIKALALQYSLKKPKIIFSVEPSDELMVDTLSEVLTNSSLFYETVLVNNKHYVAGIAHTQLFQLQLVAALLNFEIIAITTQSMIYLRLLSQEGKYPSCVSTIQDLKLWQQHEIANSPQSFLAGIKALGSYYANA